MNLLSSNDLSKAEINKVFDIADDLVEGKEGLSLKEHTTLALLFSEPSTRTRVSFEVAMAQLGGHAIFVDMSTTHLKRGETLADTAKVISGYCDFIAMRVDSHDDLLTVARNSSVPVINALTRLEHPTQALADVYTIQKHFSRIKGLKIVFAGDIAQNTANSLMITAAKLGADIALVGPKGVMPNELFFNKAREYSKVDVYNDIEEGASEADVIYTDTFVSMGLESSAEGRTKLFAPYQVNSTMMSYAREGAIAMHPLPAHRGEEISAEVLDGAQSVVWEQARNKLLLEKAVLIYLSNSA
ncbi:MAG: ornithine carbamoyltransferase [Candidatus Marsarchaeota archaeon]|jgi:ornithine carbamoyltransferase|nr:ornithine carbamoyltransferase [Candidatus Marsarchaeota archaeon]MCL5418819.1 ornithine carbamoyltransferase [Candidatus Marsarchaeota archaeon]